MGLPGKAFINGYAQKFRGILLPYGLAIHAYHSKLASILFAPAKADHFCLVNIQFEFICICICQVRKSARVSKERGRLRTESKERGREQGCGWESVEGIPKDLEKKIPSLQQINFLVKKLI